ncbi:MAG: GlxA family transcriptional regulator [Burkholderiaceae bacterium]|nr:GlxA family transcriptional regulator [Burkholderiaceae bacterium]
MTDRDMTSGRAADRPALSIGFILATNFTLSAFSLLVDVLRLAADDGDGSRPIKCRWEVMSSRPKVRSSCGIEVSSTAGFIDPAEFNYIAVIGGVLHKGPQIDDETIAYLREAAASGVSLIGVCTGSLILARAGLMTNRTCCVSWFHYEDFRNEFPEGEVTADQLFLVDRDRITCAGGSGVVDLGAHLVERHLGGSAAQKSLHILLVTNARQADDVQPHPYFAKQASSKPVQRALLLMEQNMSSPLKISAIAGRLGISSRQLDRLFQSELDDHPSQVYRRLRLRYAKWLLENTHHSITEIGHETGFCDTAHFSRHFKQLFSVAPSRLGRPITREPASANREIRPYPHREFDNPDGQRQEPAPTHS